MIVFTEVTFSVSVEETDDGGNIHLPFNMHIDLHLSLLRFGKLSIGLSYCATVVFKCKCKGFAFKHCSICLRTASHTTFVDFASLQTRLSSAHNKNVSLSTLINKTIQTGVILE